MQESGPRRSHKTRSASSRFDVSLVPQLISALLESLAGTGHLRRFLRSFLLRSPNSALRADGQALLFALFEYS